MSNFNAMSLADMSAHVTADNAKDAIAVLQARADRARNAGSAYKLAKATRAIACIEATNALDVSAVLAQAKADCGYGTEAEGFGQAQSGEACEAGRVGGQSADHARHHGRDEGRERRAESCRVRTRKRSHGRVVSPNQTPHASCVWGFFCVCFLLATHERRTTPATNAITGDRPMADNYTQPHDDEDFNDVPATDADTMEIFAFVMANQPRLITGDDA